jgi:co-chaperonin GroES (HSP10)
VSDNIPDDYTWPLIATKDFMDKVTGRNLPAKVFSFRPWGRRMLVVREESPDKMGSVWIPETAKEPLATGWVLSVGPMVGTRPQGGHPDENFGGWMGPRGHLIGMKVIFGMYAGQAFKVGDVRETSYETDYVVLNDLDIWGDVDE